MAGGRAWGIPPPPAPRRPRGEGWGKGPEGGSQWPPAPSAECPTITAGCVRLTTAVELAMERNETMGHSNGQG